MTPTKQLGFKILEGNNVRIFGGAHLTSHPKEKRPISIKKPVHLVMRSHHAKGPRSFFRHDQKILALISKQGRRFGVKLYRYANGGNHLHMVILPESRRAFNAFIRSVTGLIARLVLGAQRGAPKELQFWERRPFTRIVEWGRDYRKVCAYLLQNTLEALGFSESRPRTGRHAPKISTA
ncbi:MAG TPA: hypothetical protein VFV50_08255 [Bdellovibrionales bacterium]|nr:hypothetical protein [Bdellovibrionales bacterium]